ncbi:MAG: OmpH family outer membrane protein [Endozoicomonas sp.]
MKQIRLAVLALLMLSPLVNAAPAPTSGKSSGTRIGVLDSVMVLSESDAGRSYARQSEAKFKPRLQNLKALEAEIRQLEDKLRKDGPTLGEEPLKMRQLELRRKFEDLQLKDRQLRQEKGEADNAEREKLRPKLQRAIDEVAKEMNLDLVLERQTVIFAKPELDVTRKVIERLNKMK